MPLTVTRLISRLLDLAGPDAQSVSTKSILSSFVYDDYISFSGNREVGILLKPTARHLVDAVLNSASKRLRGLMHGGDIIWWEPTNVSNADIAKCYGHADLATHYFDAILVGAEIHIEHDEAFWTYETFKRRLQLRQLMESVDFYFHVDNLGWVAGPEWMEMNEGNLGAEWMNVQHTNPMANITPSTLANTPANLESDSRETYMTPLSLLIAMRS